MRIPNRDEKKEIREYGQALSDKDFMCWETIDRRDVFRDMRYLLSKLDLHMNIPFNHVDYSHKYCLDYGDNSIEKIKTAPDGWHTSGMKVHGI